MLVERGERWETRGAMVYLDWMEPVATREPLADQEDQDQREMRETSAEWVLVATTDRVVWRDSQDLRESLVLQERRDQKETMDFQERKVTGVTEVMLVIQVHQGKLV